MACVDGGVFCIPALVISGIALAGWLGWAGSKTEDCEDHCDHCPGGHEPPG